MHRWMLPVILSALGALGVEQHLSTAFPVQQIERLGAIHDSLDLEACFH